MTVKELIEELEAMDPTAEVHFTYNYGDHWKTKVAPAVEGVESMQVRHSEYHNMPRLVDDEEASEDGDKQVVVLS